MIVGASATSTTHQNKTQNPSSRGECFVYRTLSATTKTQSKSDAHVLFVDNSRKPAKEFEAINRSSGGAIAAALQRKEFAGECCETALVDGDGVRYVLIGTGDAGKMTEAKVRAQGAALVRTLSRIQAGAATLHIGKGTFRKVKVKRFARCLGEGVGLAAFVFDDFKATLKKNSKTPDALALGIADKEALAGVQEGLALAESTNFARRLAATPPNVATTTHIAKAAEKLAKECGLSCRIIKGDDLEKHKLTGLINVGKASENPPCLIQLTYEPKAKAKSTVMLVGKTICYDTGGLSLKISNGMKGMKYDKCGGMAVLGAMHAVARIKPKCKVVGLLPAAENSVSDEAYRPDDIITYLNGVTVEVTNTDAEGRLVLADALAWGANEHKPDAIIDLATLTGGVVTALGRPCAGYFANDDRLARKVEAAAVDSGDKVWRLPLWDEYKDMMKSQHADIWNSAPVREAHPIQGAAFLAYFVDPKTPWAHIDIAGSATLDKEVSPFTAGPTGYGVRLLASLLSAWG